jgi:acetylornithine deacetylase/succinyl-diaminopimelate desuccinylase-like protein
MNKLINRPCLYALIFVLLSLTIPLRNSLANETANNAQQANIAAMLSRVRIENLKKTIQQLQSYGNRYTWEKQCSAIRWAMEQFNKNEVLVDLHYYEFNGKSWPNIIAHVTGTKYPDKIIMLLAHIDSISDDPASGAPGADDNASGVAMLLEMARILHGSPLECSVFFCIFTNEEKGTQGSKAYVEKIKQEAMNIKAAINVDIIGYNRPNKVFDLAAVTSQITIKHKLKSLVRMTGNYYRSFAGDNVIKIAGRGVDKALLTTTAKAIRTADAGLIVKETIENSCG